LEHPGLVVSDLQWSEQSKYQCSHADQAWTEDI
jgi:hypothetical protein